MFLSQNMFMVIEKEEAVQLPPSLTPVHVYLCKTLVKWFNFLPSLPVHVNICKTHTIGGMVQLF